MIYGKQNVIAKFDEFDAEDPNQEQDDLIVKVIEFFVKVPRKKSDRNPSKYYKDIYQISKVLYAHIESKYGLPSLMDQMRDKFDL